MEFPKQEYQSGLPFLPAGDHPDPRPLFLLHCRWKLVQGLRPLPRTQSCFTNGSLRTVFAQTMIHYYLAEYLDLIFIVHLLRVRQFLWVCTIYQAETEFNYNEDIFAKIYTLALSES